MKCCVKLHEITLLCTAKILHCCEVLSKKDAKIEYHIDTHPHRLRFQCKLVRRRFSLACTAVTHDRYTAQHIIHKRKRARNVRLLPSLERYSLRLAGTTIVEAERPVQSKREPCAKPNKTSTISNRRICDRTWTQNYIVTTDKAL